MSLLKKTNPSESIKKEKPEQVFFNTNQAAKFLNLKPQTLANWRNLRRGPDYHMFGRIPMYSKIGLLEYADSNRVKLSA